MKTRAYDAVSSSVMKVCHEPPNMATLTFLQCPMPVMGHLREFQSKNVFRSLRVWQWKTNLVVQVKCIFPSCTNGISQDLKMNLKITMYDASSSPERSLRPTHTPQIARSTGSPTSRATWPVRHQARQAGCAKLSRSTPDLRYKPSNSLKTHCERGVFRQTLRSKTLSSECLRSALPSLFLLLPFIPLQHICDPPIVSLQRVDGGCDGRATHKPWIGRRSSLICVVVVIVVVAGSPETPRL